MANTKRFNGRGLVSLLVAGGFAVMAVSGIMLFLAPPGRIAHWVDWALLGLTKDQWGDLHIVAGALFLGAGIWHLVNNWKPFLHHLRTRARGLAIPRREGAVALAVLALLAIGAVERVPPITTLLEARDSARDWWSPALEDQPPFGHAEEISLVALAYRIHKDVEAAVAALTDAGLTVPAGRGTTLRDVADANGVTPAFVYARLAAVPEVLGVGGTVDGGTVDGGAEPLSAEMLEARFAGIGVGRQTLAEVARTVGQPVEALLWRLSRHGLEAGPDDRLKPLAEAAGQTPLEVLRLALIGQQPASGD